jgi:NAD(P)-dependent dehydrogenase (short-subunit alcohol dehydrogenase family)
VSQPNAEDMIPPPSVHRLDGKVALVTGAGRGIGRACAITLADAGAELILASRTPGEIDQVADLIKGRGGKARAAPCDVLDGKALAALFAGIPKLDVLVNNAGGNRPKPFLEMSEDDLDFVLNINLRSAYLVAQHAARRMKAGGGGVIVNMSSQMGHVGGLKRTAYCAAKHAIEGFTKAAALDLAADNIRVVAVGPTFIETAMTRPFLADANFKNTVLQSIPLARTGTVWEVAHAVTFLASPAASLITGTCLLIDGGWTAR